jgi:formylglycine-generating enzyme required for sulfatase activity
MVESITRFKNRLSVSKNSYGFIFYAGHGVQFNGVNYLIPAKADIPNANYLGDMSISVQTRLAELNDAGNELNIVVLDACRDFPAAWSRNSNRGLTVVANQPADSIIVFATSAGSTSADGNGRNGLFTGHLLTNLKAPGLEVTEVFRLTGAAVSQASGRKQNPAVYNQFYGTAYLGTRPAANTPVQPAPAVQPAPVTPAAIPQHITPGEMVRINGGTFIMGSPTGEPGRYADETPHQVTVSPFFMGKYEVTQKEYQELMGINPSSFKGDNLPVEQVSWYDAIEYCNKLSLKEGLNPAYTIDKSRKDPNNKNRSDKVKWVVSWNRNANGYRLPSEAEWEYACRAGTTTTFSTGDNITTDLANYDGNNPYNDNGKGEFRKRTSLVGTFPPNAWDLFDMHGNIYEWCWDWYGNYSSGAQTDPAGASSGKNRVGRGGAWAGEGRLLRSAHRVNSGPHSRCRGVGFRLVRSELIS